MLAHYTFLSSSSNSFVLERRWIWLHLVGVFFSWMCVLRQCLTFDSHKILIVSVSQMSTLFYLDRVWNTLLVSVYSYKIYFIYSYLQLLQYMSLATVANVTTLQLTKITIQLWALLANTVLVNIIICSSFVHNLFSRYDFILLFC